MNKPWHTWISHGTNMNASYHTERITKRYGNCDVRGGECDEGVMFHIWMSHGAPIWMSHGTHMNELWHKYEWVMAQIWMSHGTNMNDSWYAYEWVVSHRTYYLERRQLWCARGRMWWRSHLTHMNESWCTRTNESWHKYEWVMAQIWMSHGTNMNKSWHKYECVVSHRAHH